MPHAINERLNEVRPGRPEQYGARPWLNKLSEFVSMKSGLEDRNNGAVLLQQRREVVGLNEVRPGRPEQSETNAAENGKAGLSQ